MRNSTPKVQSALQLPACVAVSFNLMLVSTIPVKRLINASTKNATSISSKSAGSRYCKRKKEKIYLKDWKFSIHFLPYV